MVQIFFSCNGKDFILEKQAANDCLWTTLMSIAEVAPVELVPESIRKNSPISLYELGYAMILDSWESSIQFFCWMCL